MKRVGCSYDNVNDAFMNGFLVGINWPNKWETHGEPGGPWVYSAYNYWAGAPDYQETIDNAKESDAQNKAWRKGWKYGHECKLKGKNPLDQKEIERLKAIDNEARL